MLELYHLAEVDRNHMIDGQDHAVVLAMMNECMIAGLVATDASVAQTMVFSQVVATTIDVVAPMEVCCVLIFLS